MTTMKMMQDTARFISDRSPFTPPTTFPWRGGTQLAPYEVTSKPGTPNLRADLTSGWRTQPCESDFSAGLRLPARPWMTADEKEGMPDARTDLVISSPTGPLIDVPGFSGDQGLVASAGTVAAMKG